MASSKPFLVIYHLSDLHFGLYLEGVSREGGEFSSVVAPHNFLLLGAMETALNYKNVVLKHKNHLMVAVTGDITTTAEPPAYHNANNYLRDYPFVSNWLKVGLRLQEIGDRLFIVPGNHDVWLYGKALTKWKGHPNRRTLFNKYFGEQAQKAYPFMAGGVPITVFTIDTNRVGRCNLFNIGNVLGKGEVGDAQIAEIQATHNNLLSGNFDGIPNHFDYSSSLKIALMHHHLAPPQEKPEYAKKKILSLKDSAAVLNLLGEIGVRLVLCGHLHFPYHITSVTAPGHPGKPIFLSCAGSTTQIGCKKNSFSLYELSKKKDGYRLRLCVYEADSEHKDYNFRLTVDKPYSL